MANEVVLNTIFQLKRGLAEAWERNNPVLRAAEPGYELDTGKLKIGDGSSHWKDLSYFGGEFEIATDGLSIKVNDQQLLELSGFSTAGIGMVPRKSANGELEWYTPIDVGVDEIVKSEEFITAIDTHIDKVLEGTEEKPGIQNIVENLTEKVELIDKSTQKTRYVVSNIAKEAIIRYRENEIRIMFPADMNWQLEPTGGQSNYYYFGIKAYAPSDEVVSFKEDMLEVINDETMYYFEDNEFAGIEEDGRKYSIIWLPAASYDEASDTWTYFGDNSSEDKYVGWYHTIDWYDAEGNIIGKDSIRINLSNENCHNFILPYYLDEYQKKTDTISISRLVNDENTVVILNGGSAENAVLS